MLFRSLIASFTRIAILLVTFVAKSGGSHGTPLIATAGPAAYGLAEHPDVRCIVPRLATDAALMAVHEPT